MNLEDFHDRGARRLFDAIKASEQREAESEGPFPFPSAADADKEPVEASAKPSHLAGGLTHVTRRATSRGV